MIGIILFLWILSAMLCWIIYLVASEFDAKWCDIIDEHDIVGIALMTAPVISTLFLAFLIFFMLWKILKVVIFNRKFWRELVGIFVKIWRS